MNVNELKEQLLSYFKEFQKEAEQDSKFDKLKIPESLQNISENMVKWQNRKLHFFKLMKDIDKKLKQQYSELYEFYKTSYDVKLSTKNEIEVFIEADKSYYELKYIKDICHELYQYCEKITDILNKKMFQIKMFIEWQKFINGD